MNFYRLYCAPNKCYMTLNGCLHRQNAVAEGVPVINGQACIGCKTGEEVKQKLSDDTREEKPRHQCIWPNCTKKPTAFGLCATHCRHIRHNKLIQCNTAGREADKVVDMLKRLAAIADSCNLSIEDVVFVCLDKGIETIEAIKF